MKYLFIYLCLLGINLMAQENSSFTYFDDKSGKECLIGVCDRTAFSDTLYSGWFDSEYEEYSIDVEEISKISKLFDGTEIKVVMATWCSDSRREVPRLFKILDSLNYPADQIIIINVNREKNGVADETAGLDIKLVPTIIVYKNQTEIGRIIETPVQSLEKDLAEIFLIVKEE